VSKKIATYEDLKKINQELAKKIEVRIKK